MLAWNTTASLFLTLCAALVPLANGAEPAAERPTCRIRLDAGHPWRPPFGPERIGRPLVVMVEIASDRQPPPECVLVGYVQNNEIARSPLTLAGKSPYTCRATFDPWPAQLVLLVKSEQGSLVELARLAVAPPPFEADAVARPDRIINPVDLGTILPPSDWLLLTDGRKGRIDVAAIGRTADMPKACVTAWFDSAPAAKMTATVAMVKDRRAQLSLRLPPTPVTVDHDVLHVSVAPPDGAELWHKRIETMVVHYPPQWPAFGAVETKLRYDAPISILAGDGKLSSMSYADAWNPKLKDVVVTTPNGSRFIFWRGSCYIPFWASRQNVGFCYEWAEGGAVGADAVDCVEPLMDKELRYGRVRIIESTPARVHVRWSYQSCDFNYKVWGDSSVEDYYFYPDGFGTRVLTIQSDAKTSEAKDYELSEFIVLTPQSTYPLSVFPSHMVDILFTDGQKRKVTFPFFASEQGEKKKTRGIPAIYRVRLHKDEPMDAIYFNPLDRNLPATFYDPFFDKGELVTSFYWGSHWPLARGKTTGWAIDGRIASTPCHNSVMSWAQNRPAPVRAAMVDSVDTLGRSKPMQVRTWVWLIGMSDASDDGLMDWAKSFAQPASLVDIRGARLAPEPYSPERRAMRLIAESAQVTLTIKPTPVCVNPVLELAGAPGALIGVQLAGRNLDAKHYAWDGKTLWIQATLAQPTSLRLEFGSVGGSLVSLPRIDPREWF
jgi:hypothetical protein